MPRSFLLLLIGTSLGCASTLFSRNPSKTGACAKKVVLGTLKNAVQLYLLYSSNTVMWKLSESRGHGSLLRSKWTSFLSLNKGMRPGLTVLILMCRLHWTGYMGCKENYSTWPHSCAMYCTTSWKISSSMLLRRKRWKLVRGDQV